MSISEGREKPARDDRASLIRTSKVYLAATVFCALFGAVYERFGHGVYSYFMIYAFALPLLLGLLPALLFCTAKGEIVSSRKGRRYWNAGVATLTVGFLFKGALDIYGTDSPFFTVYIIAGAALLLAGQATGAAARLIRRKKEKNAVPAKKG